MLAKKVLYNKCSGKPSFRFIVLDVNVQPLHTAHSVPIGLTGTKVLLWPQLPEVIKGEGNGRALHLLGKGLIETPPSSRGHPVPLVNSRGLSCLSCLLTSAQLGLRSLKCHSYRTASFFLDFASLMNQGYIWLIETILLPLPTQCTRKANYTNSTCRIHFVLTISGVTESLEPWFMESFPLCAVKGIFRRGHSFYPEI